MRAITIAVFIAMLACEAADASGEVINVATAGRISLNRLLEVMNSI